MKMYNLCSKTIVNLKVTEMEKDLGVWIDNDLKYIANNAESQQARQCQLSK